MILTTLAALLLSFLQAPAPASPAAAAQPTITFRFENPQLRPPSYRFEIHRDGTGRYQSDPVPATPGATVPADAGDAAIAPPPINREIRITEPLLSQLFAAATSPALFKGICEAPKEHVAFTGKKTLTVSGPDGHGSCEFNYARDPQLNRLAEALISVAFTLEEGEQLAVEQEHSPLALDAELETLQDAAKGGRALELNNIAQQLQAVADDESVLLRARKRARALLSGTTRDH